MAHLIRGLSGTTQPDALRQFERAHAFLVDRARDSLSQLSLRRERWGAFAKRASVDLSGPGRDPLVSKDSERIVEVINMTATLERLIDALRYFANLPDSRTWLVLECHPSTSSSEGGNDLVLGPFRDDIRIICEVTDVVSSTASQNQKERKDLASLGCREAVTTDGVRRFICTSREYGGALASPQRPWASMHYRYRVVELENTVLLELQQPSAKVLPQPAAAGDS